MSLFTSAPIKPLSGGSSAVEPGVFYGLGVGPGDPDLLTVKAVKILGQVDKVFTAARSDGERSLAGRIAAPHLRPGVVAENLAFPMTEDFEILEKAWRRNARTVADVLEAGLSAAFLTLGDCLTYSTYAYILPSLYEIMPQAKVVSVPGLTSFQLAAAKLNRPLVSGRESLTILGAAESENMETLLAASDNLVLMKTYRDTQTAVKKIKQLGLADRAALCANLALEGETIVDGLDEESAIPKSYFSLILVNKKRRP
jgi:precorrin-2/cobalt-factor-2 C20-methyltransferase